MTKEKAILIGVSLKGNKKEDSLRSMRELHDLSTAASIEVIDKIIQIRERIHPGFFLGKGKLEELKEDITSQEVDTVIFDDDLSPIQLRNIEAVLDCKVIGRTELILDIFATRARTKEARLQVEYAQLSYLLPRLRRRWTHLSRIEGGIGFRGPGETQLESDRRAVKKRLFVIKKQLKKISIQFATKRKRRLDKYIVSLVGYTNAGKSSLLNLLTNEKVLVDDAPFATLDSTVRKAFISDELNVLLIDTVGFIKKLPHHLIASFKSTLEEVKSANLLLHVVDVSEEGVIERINAVNEVLKELESMHTPIIYVFNKIDLLADNHNIPERFSGIYEKSCFISVETNEGIEKLKSMIEKEAANYNQ